MLFLEQINNCIIVPTRLDVIRSRSNPLRDISPGGSSEDRTRDLMVSSEPRWPLDHIIVIIIIIIIIIINGGGTIGSNIPRWKFRGSNARPHG